MVDTCEMQYLALRDIDLPTRRRATSVTTDFIYFVLRVCLNHAQYYHKRYIRRFIWSITTPSYLSYVWVAYSSSLAQDSEQQ
jgi:hypothetical protein